MGFGFDFGATVNAVEAETFVEKYDGTDWRFVFKKEEGTSVKGTATIPLAKDGRVKLEGSEKTGAFETTVSTTVNGTAGFWWRISWTAALTASIVINEIYALSGWNDLTITDGTASGGAPFAIAGAVTWTDDGAQVETKVNGAAGLWYRLKTSADLDAVGIYELFAQTRQAWELRLYDPVGASSLWSVTANGSGSQDLTLGTPRQTLYFELVAKANQKAVGNSSIQGNITTLIVYSETGNINTYEIANDIRGALTELSTNTTALDSTNATLDLTPFITNAWETYASILTRAAAFGDTAATGGALGYGLRSSQLASDGKPLMFLEQWPVISDLTVYDYQVSTKTAQIPSVRRDYASIKNWLIINYTDNLTGLATILTPDDFAALTDATSVARYERRIFVLSLGACTEAAALGFGARYLAAYKDPLISATGAITVTEYLTGKNGNLSPASEIQAGKRLKIIDYEEGIMGVITSTQYNHTARTCAITLGYSDNLAIILARGLDNSGGGELRL